MTDRNKDGNQNVLTISAQAGLISQAEYFSRRVASDEVGGYFRLRRGDFAYNKSYSAGFPVGVIRRLERYSDGIVSPLYICFRPSSLGVNSDFLKYYFAAGLLDDDIAWVAKEGVRNHGLLNVGVEDFFSVDVDVPPLLEQRRIAEILDTLDEAIRKTEQLIAKLQQVKQGLLHDLLIRGINDNGELRDPARHPDQFKDSPGGLIPKTWKTGVLGSYIEDIRYGTSAPSEAGADGVPVLRIPNVQNGRLELSDLKYQRPTSADIDRFSVRAGDLLVIRTNGNPRLLGRCAEVPAKMSSSLFASYLIRIRLDRGALLPEFASVLMNSSRSRSYIETRAATSAGNYNINTSQLRAMPIAFPSIGEQERIVAMLTYLQDRLDLEVAQVEKLRVLKAGLMQDLLTGRVRVTNLLTEAAA